ncbi:MAG: Spx/MgsR family RNA polymerase-binding regulatory protein, partial [Rhodocyclaceae bacterium]|nr:Spx/MgsR family RNA polymerase-binding regulatory protein [Rhodocyclaceae bacterium]
MHMVTIYGIKNCDTMKKAFAWLDQHGVAYEFHDYKKSGVPEAQLRDWMARAGWEALVNRRGPTFRKLPPERQSDLDAQRACDLLKEFP